MTSDRWDDDIESWKSEVEDGSSAWWMMHISLPPCVHCTHAHTFTPFLAFNWCPALICSLYPSLVPLLLFFIKWSFPVLASSNESVMPPHTHLSKHVGRMAQCYGITPSHTHPPSLCHHIPVSIRIVCHPSALHPPLMCLASSHYGSRVIVFDSFSFSCQISFDCWFHTNTPLRAVHVLCSVASQLCVAFVQRKSCVIEELQREFISFLSWTYTDGKMMQDAVPLVW